MRTKTFLAVAACTISAAGLAAGSSVAAADPSPNADCIAQLIAAGGPPAGAPGQSGLAADRGVSTVAQRAHDACLSSPPAT
jgi:hypothetical protein